MTAKRHPHYCEIAISELHKGRYQPRAVFDPEDLQRLADTILVHGLIQPIVVRPLQDGYEIIAGERRYRAAKLAGLTHVQCLVKHCSDEDACALTMLENTGRLDLNPIEEARAYQRLIDEFHYLHEEVASAAGKSRAAVSNALRLLKLDGAVRDMLIAGQLSEGHGKIIAGLARQDHLSVAMQCVEQGWSVRRLEQFLRKTPKREKQPPAAAQDPDIKALESTIAEQLGTKVSFEPDNDTRGGELVIRYYDTETLAGLLDKMNIQYE